MKNIVLLPFFILALVINGKEYGFSYVMYSLLYVTVTIIVFVVISRFASFGAGLVKLAAVVSCIMGIKFVVVALLFAFLVFYIFMAIINYIGKDTITNLVSDSITYINDNTINNDVWMDNGRFRFTYCFVIGSVISIFISPIIPL